MPYHHFKDAEGKPYGSFEVFYNDGKDPDFKIGDGSEAAQAPAGWYWWACFPGCMPDGDPMGPFDTEQQAIDNTQEDY